jgi:hypothetical protein
VIGCSLNGMVVLGGFVTRMRVDVINFLSHYLQIVAKNGHQNWNLSAQISLCQKLEHEDFNSGVQWTLCYIIFKQWIIDPTVSHNAMCIPEVVCIKNCITYKALLKSILGSISAKYEDEKSITYVNLDELDSWMYFQVGICGCYDGYLRRKMFLIY